MTGEQARRRALLAAVALVALGAPFTVATQPSYVIVVHPSNPARQVDKAFLRDAFLKRRPNWPNDVGIRPVDLTSDSPVREQFSRDVLQRRVGEVKNYWYQQIFSGKAVPPPQLETEAEVIAYVLRNSGAVGYVSAGSPTGGAKVLPVK